MAGLQTTVSEFLEEISPSGRIDEDLLRSELDLVFGNTSGVNRKLVDSLVSSLLIFSENGYVETNPDIDKSTTLISALCSHQPSVSSGPADIDNDSNIR